MRILSELAETQYKEIVVRFRGNPRVMQRLHNLKIIVRRGGTRDMYGVGSRFNPTTSKRERISISGNTEVVKIPKRDKKRKRHR